MAMAVLLPWLAWFAVSFLALHLLDLFTHSRRRLPPGPRPLPLLGNLHLLSRQPHRSLARLAKTYGPLMSLRLGTVTTVVVSSPEVAREFLQKHDAVFASRSVPDATGEHAKNSVPWLPNGPRWRALRRTMAAELFAPQRLEALHHLRREKVRELVDHVGRLAREGAAVDVGQVVFTTGLNLLSRMIFSHDLADLDNRSGDSKEIQVVCAEVMEVAGIANVSDFFPALAAVDLQGARRRMSRLFARLHRMFDAEVAQRLRGRSASEPRKNDFLDALLDDAKAGIDGDTLRSLFTDLYAAGMNNISNTMEWAMSELLENPSVMSKVCDELSRVIGSRRNIEESEICELPYLQAVVKESLRLHPPAPLLLPRQADATTTIMGYTIPKGARVHVNVWAMGRDESIWPEPDKFVPERFLDDDDDKQAAAADIRGADFELLPFGSGRRICPGMTLAIRMVHTLLASLLNQYKWTPLPADGGVQAAGNGRIDMSEKFGVNVTKVVPLHAIATPI